MKHRSTFVTTVLLLLITLVAFGLRFYHVGAQSLWYDEGFSVYLARMSLAEITTQTAADIQPPLYYYLLHAWIGLFGDGESVLRGLSLLFGVGAVPLIYAVARRLFRSYLAGLLAALLLAVSPAHVWYGQEVRMYTLLTFLCLLSSYFLLLIVQRLPTYLQGEDRFAEGNGAREAFLWLSFAVVSIAAIYTHYFAFFVLAFQALYVLLVWWGRGLHPTRFIVGGLVSGVTVALAYVPWLQHLLTRYSADLSYWPGHLKLHEVLVDSALFFVGGESVSESVGMALAVGFGLILILCWIALLSVSPGRKQAREGRGGHALSFGDYPLSFLFLYLVLPPALIIALAYNSPKFNARYVMVAHPALLLILAGGLAVLLQRRSGLLSNLFRGTIGAIALSFVLGVSAYANFNAYTSPGFSRADFRGAAQYIAKHAEPDEIIILLSGHIFPVFDYYAPGVERYLLPDSPTLDTTRTLDYSIAADLNDWLADRAGVWVVLWQDEVVDPVGYLTSMLAAVGEEQPIDRTFAQVGLRHYRLPQGLHFSEQPAIAHPADINFGNQLRLLGYTQTGAQQVTLFWQALQSVDEDYRVSIVLRDVAGQSWGRWDGRPTSYLYPTDRWRTGQIVFGRYELSLEPGTPPGDYGLAVGVYTENDPVGLDLLDEAGAPRGKRAMLGAVRLSVPAVTAAEVNIPHPVQMDMGGGLELLGWDLDGYQAQPGDRLLLTLVWSVLSRPGVDYRVRLLLTDISGQVVDAGTFPPTNAWHPTGGWDVGQVWRGQSTFRLPIRAEPGEARLAVQLVNKEGAAVGSPFELTVIQVQPTNRVFTPPPFQVARQANFDNRMTLLGADLEPDTVPPGDLLQVTLYWQALVEMDVPYSVFVHLLAADGRVVTGHDGEPVGGTRPTTGWVPGEYISDVHQVSIPADLPPGEYIVEVGVYDAGLPSMPRLGILGEGEQVETDRVIFGPVRVR